MAARTPGELPDPEEPIASGDKNDKALKQRIAELEAQLEASKSSEQKALEQVALNKANAQSQALFGPANVEVQTGVDENDEPIFALRIDLPPSGGEFIRINGEPFYHGVTYTFDMDRLRSVKEIIARSWGHEATINGSNENAYRKPKDTRIGGRH